MNSQPGTIIHELSHFKDVMDTDDHSYGDKKKLARNNPSKARTNADNLNGYEDEMAILGSPLFQGV